FMRDEQRPQSGVTFEAALQGVVERAEASEPIIQTLPCGLELLDGTTGGLVRGEYLAVVGSPGCGKSLLADRVSVGVLRANPDASALMLNLETATSVRTARLIAGHCVQIGEASQIVRCVPLGALLRGKLTRDGQRLVREAAEALSNELGRRLRFV